jgi:hypothetical protein
VVSAAGAPSLVAPQMLRDDGAMKPVSRRRKGPTSASRG